MEISSAEDQATSHPKGLERIFLTNGEVGDTSDGSDQRRLLELQLLHHFITVAALTFPSSNLQRSREMWTIDCVRMGFQYKFLLNAIFAVAALHLVRDIPDSPRFRALEGDPKDFQSNLSRPTVFFGEASPQKVFRFYLDLAVTQHRQAITGMTAENANALILSSVLISYQGLGLLPSEQESSEYSLPIKWLYMTRGITEVSDFSSRIVRPNSISDYMSLVGGEPNFKDRAALFNPDLRRPFEHLLNWDLFSEPELDVVTKETYELTLSYVGRIYAAVESEESPRIIFRLILGLPIMAPPRFIVFVEERRPRALVILAHYFAMAKAIDDHWIFAGLADREVRGIKGVLPDGWEWALEWPQEMILKWS